MALRLIKLILPKSSESRAIELLEKHPAKEIWSQTLSDNTMMIEALIQAGGSESILDRCEQWFGNLDEFKIILLPVEASIPRERSTITETDKSNKPKVEPIKRFSTRVSREELYSDIVDSVELTHFYTLMILFSAIVAGIGLIKDNSAIIIGAMVIAPLLGPNVALSFGTTLGDWKLVRKSLRANLFGLLIVIIVSTTWGLLQPITSESPEMLNRTSASLSDIVLALTAGGAGVLSLSMATVSALVGVMIAVALLPPLVTSGLLLGSGYFDHSIGAFFVFLANFICINLAGIITFLFQGIRPLPYSSADKAKRATYFALVLWFLLLIGLVLLIYLRF